MKTYDVVIVGGGIIGCSIAFELSRRNVRVVLLDRQELMREASWAAAGMLSPAPDCPAAIPLVPLGLASLATYPHFIPDIEEASGKRAGYRTGGTLEALFHGDAERELSTLVALHHGLGLACEAISIEEAQVMEPALGREARGAAFLPDEASVNTRALAATVIAAAESSGAELRPGVEVVSLEQEGNRCTGVQTRDGETISAKHVVLAAGSWTSQMKQAAPYAPTKPVRGQMVALLNSGRLIHSVMRSEYGYIVPRDLATPQRLVAGSTIEHVGFEKAVTSGGIEQILTMVNEIAPDLACAELLETWSGLRPGTPDELPILGPTDMDGLLIATGHYRNGILLAPITAKVIAECITDGKPSIDLKDFSPLRFLSEKSDD